MNSNQTLVLIAVAVLLVLVLLFPPFYFPGFPESKFSPLPPTNSGRAFILRPPDFEGGFAWGYTRVDVPQLLAEYLFIVTAGLLFFAVLSKTGERSLVDYLRNAWHKSRARWNNHRNREDTALEQYSK